MRVDPAQLFRVNSIAENARAAFVAATARRDRVRGWLDAQQRPPAPVDGKGRPVSFMPTEAGAMSPTARAQALDAASAEAEHYADHVDASAAARAAAISRLEADLKAATADVERAAQAQAQSRALADACQKMTKK